MKSSVSFLLLIFLGFAAFSQTAKLNIAVNDLSAKGIKQSEAEIISERFRSELLNTGVFKVMERNDMASVLKEQGFQQTGACDEASCLVEVGQLLGVERIVAGSVGKIAGMHTISLRMINVATGEIMFTVSEDYQGDLTGVLTSAVGNAARKLAEGGGENWQKLRFRERPAIYISPVRRVGLLLKLTAKRLRVKPRLHSKESSPVNAGLSCAKPNTTAPKLSHSPPMTFLKWISLWKKARVR